jgi:hypothetical protein
MTTPQNEIALISGQGEGKTPHVNSNSVEAQRQRLLVWFMAHGMISTLTARRDLDILAPAARVHELRHRYGHRIDLVWVNEPTDCGKLHRVGQYVLQGEASHD